ncbi:class I SAM-dependent methyltransferase [Rhizomicrobium electricum]|nr:class I SAM-dependent methyltransferase [Rhizomicrobium electricum]NIJ49422.1 S-adenosylmethionine-diacylgycerolhomoserine-N-methyltransferase [Rhizomicrobium electricum]
MSGRVDDHSALMDRIYRHQRYIYDITRKYYLFGRDRMIRELNLKPGDRLVEIGCGTARNLVKIARRYPEARLYGLDASHEMLKSAAQTVARAGLSDRITLAHGYAENLSPAMFGETEPFEACLFSYSLSMIPDWRGAINAASHNLAAGGHIHIVDFGDLTGLGGLARAMMMGWLHLFHVAPREELLARLEHEPGAALRLLPGRYAFLLSTGTLSV